MLSIPKRSRGIPLSFVRINTKKLLDMERGRARNTLYVLSLARNQQYSLAHAKRFEPQAIWKIMSTSLRMTSIDLED